MKNVNQGSHPTGWLFRWICWVTGTDPEILATCPQRDRDHITTIALIQLAVFVWQTLVFTLAAHIMLAKDGTFRPELVAVALLLAAIVGLIDGFMIIRSSWYLHGLEQLCRAGLVLPEKRSATLKNACFVVIRFCMASVLAALVGPVISILVFTKDVNARLDAKFQSANSQLIQSATGEYDHATGDLEQSREPLQAQLAKDVDLSGQSGLFGLTAYDAEAIQAAAARAASAERERSAAVSELRDAQTFATDELAGLHRNPRNSGIPGRGPLRLAAEERLRQAEKRLRDAEADLIASRKRVEDLRLAAASQARQQGDLLGPRLASIETIRRQHQEELARLDATLIERQAGRAAAIQSAVERNPSYRPREDGLLARAHALVTIAEEDPWTRSMIVALSVFLFIVELAAVAVKSFTFVPSAYAGRLAQEECLSARKISHSIAEAFNLLADGGSLPKPRQQPPNTIDPEPDVDGEPPSPVGNDGLSAAFGVAATHGDADTAAPSRPRGRPPKQPRTQPSERGSSSILPQRPPDQSDGLFGEPV